MESIPTVEHATRRRFLKQLQRKGPVFGWYCQKRSEAVRKRFWGPKEAALGRQAKERPPL